MPDHLIEEGLKQPDCIKVSFEKGTKKITGHIAPDQARFGSEYFLAYTLPDFKSKILTQLSAEQNVKTLLNKSLNIYDVKRTMFCLSFPSRDRATAPGLYEY